MFLGFRCFPNAVGLVINMQLLLSAFAEGERTHAYSSAGCGSVGSNQAKRISWARNARVIRPRSLASVFPPPF